ncbi:CPBP family intramembrane glutamic endopeptidase [Microbacterium sp. BH-3-3-3]|uniref:CPBP family intramembrane glutamic endopeptidase n=1 Tax=Microbacterium sp. BH-3-3-3 TaxID=1906742 RepID=UPI0011AB1F19|nr:CPBP family intramembrane glutamic endopeptidase [Microbacterium sp. BH-3-3-3]
MRTDWRFGGRAVSRWNSRVLAAALFGAGVGMLAAGTIGRLGQSWAPAASAVAVSLGLGAAIVYALVRSRPAGLLRFRAVDVLWGLGLGLSLRLLQGALSDVNHRPFPALPGVQAGESDGSVVTAISQALFVGPVAEEFFFRALVLVSIYQLLRRSVGSFAAGLTGALASAGSFVLLHAVFESLSLSDGLQLFALGVACSAVVLLTGRIWPAVLAHIVYNASFVLLATLGSVLA